MIPASQLQLADPTEHQVSALSAALLQAVMNTYGENHEGFALRAGVAVEVVAEAAAGIGPAWALPYGEFTALADAVAALWPCAVFETAAACDLLLSCVLNGDQFLATDVLTEPGTQDLGRALLRLAITSEPASATREAREALLPEHLLAVLTERAVALARSGLPDAWVGVEILVTSLSRQS